MFVCNNRWSHGVRVMDQNYTDTIIRVRLFYSERKVQIITVLIKFVSDLRLPVSSTNKTDHHNNWNIVVSGVKHHSTPEVIHNTVDIDLSVRVLDISSWIVDFLFVWKVQIYNDTI